MEFADANADFDYFTLDYGISETPVQYITLKDHVTNPMKLPDKLFSWDLKDIPAGVLTVRIYMHSTRDTYAKIKIHLNVQVPTPTPTPTMTSTATMTPTATITPSPTPVPTATPLPTSTLPPPPPPPPPTLTLDSDALANDEAINHRMRLEHLDLRRFVFDRISIDLVLPGITGKQERAGQQADMAKLQETPTGRDSLVEQGIAFKLE